MDEEDKLLTPAARDAIRGYLLRLLVPGAILSFAAGFLINDLARGQAYNKAYESALDFIVKGTTEMAELRAEAKRQGLIIDTSRQAAEQAAVATSRSLKEVRTITERLRVAESLAQSTGVVNSVKESLIADQAFRSALLRDLSGVVKACRLCYQFRGSDGGGQYGQCPGAPKERCSPWSGEPGYSEAISIDSDDRPGWCDVYVKIECR